MPARRLTTIRPAMTAAEALETMHVHRIAGRTGDRTAWVTSRPFRAPHQTISDAGLVGGGTCRGLARGRSRTTGCSSWMNCPSSAATSWRFGDNHSRMASQSYNLPHVLDL
jgi:Magnesium chelatase, subunit ChlI